MANEVADASSTFAAPAPAPGFHKSSNPSRSKSRASAGALVPRSPALSWRRRFLSELPSPALHCMLHDHDRRCASFPLVTPLACSSGIPTRATIDLLGGRRVRDAFAIAPDTDTSTVSTPVGGGSSALDAASSVSGMPPRTDALVEDRGRASSAREEEPPGGGSSLSAEGGPRQKNALASNE